MAKMLTLIERWRKRGPAWWAEHEFGWIMEDGRPITLLPWQKAVLSSWWKHRDTTSALAISAPKKVGKTLLNSVLLAWRFLALGGLHYANANDLDQSAGRQFLQVAAMVKRHPLLAEHVKAGRWRLEFQPTGALLEALPVDAAGSAGADHWTSSHTECWGILHENARRTWEELTGQPGTIHGFPSLRIADSYAGFLSESETWHGLVDRGLTGERLPGTWPMWKVGGLLLFHMSGDTAQKRCFRGTAAQRRAYYADQAADLRPGAFRRLHKNERASSEDAFILPEQWAGCVVDGFRIPGPDRSVRLFVGLDLAVKKDFAACVSVFKKDGVSHIGPYKIWKPAPVVDLDAIEEYLLDLAGDYTIAGAGADPFQAQMLMQRCERAGLRIAEYAQTQSGLTVAGNLLWDLIRTARLVVPGRGAEELRSHVLAATARETPRGIRLIKGTGQIDGAIALSIALVLAGPGWDVAAAGAMAELGLPDYLVSDKQMEAAAIARATGRSFNRRHSPFTNQPLFKRRKKQ